MDILVQAGYRVYAVDLPGFGKSAPAPSAPRAWLRAFLDTVGIESPVLVSPSMSGRYALPLVTEEPARLAGFVAVAPVGVPDYQQIGPEVERCIVYSIVRAPRSSTTCR